MSSSAPDNAFQRRARLLQALWRAGRGLPAGERRLGVPLGSRLAKDYAKETGSNLMPPPAALAAARREVAAMPAGSGQKVDEDRLWANLLSSQQFAFNSFGELSADSISLRACSAGLRLEPLGEVTHVGFANSPAGGSAAYTADRTAFDGYVEHTTPRS